MVERDQEELFTVCLDDDGHPVQRTVADMTPDEVSTAIDHLTVAGRSAGAHEKLARLLWLVAEKHPSLHDPA
jgi:hypothetical protein